MTWSWVRLDFSYGSHKLTARLSPDPCLSPYEKDFKWLTQVYESVKPVSGKGRLLWHRLGAKTIELINENVINENVPVEAVRDDIEARPEALRRAWCRDSHALR